MRYCKYALLTVVLVLAGCQKDTTDSTGGTDMMTPPIDMGTDAMSAVDGGMESDTSTPTPDMGVTGGSCGEGNIKDFVAEATMGEDGTLTLEDQPSGRADFAGSCGGDGNEQGYRFTAPSAGTWTFTLGSDIPNLDTVMYARADCTDADSEITCNDDRIPGQVVLSRIQLELDAEQTVYIFADVYSGAGDIYTLEARRIPVVADGEVCDGSGEQVSCAIGSFCRVDPEGDSVDGVCVADSAPVINEVLAFRSGNGLNLQINASDEGADVVTGRLQLYQGDTRIILDPSQNADTFIMNPIDSVFGQQDIAYRYRANVFENWPQTTSVRVLLLDSQNNQSEWAQVDVGTAPAAPLDDCDQHRILNACLNGRACLDPDGDGQFACVEITAPTIRRAKGYYLAEERLIGFEIDGDDPDNDVSVLGLELLAADGTRVAGGTIAFQNVVSVDGQYSATVSFRLADDFEFDDVRVQAIDAEGLASEFRDLNGLRPPLEAGAGDSCDPLGARAVCEAGLYCYPGEMEGAPVCGEPNAACPDDWPMPTIIEGAGPEWRNEGDLATQRNVTAGSCGGGSAQAIFQFTAPESATYSFLANSTAGGADPVIYARSHCGFDGAFPEFELGCSDDHSRFTTAGLVRLDLNEGDTVYLFVDGIRGDNGPWRGPFTLVTRRLP